MKNSFLFCLSIILAVLLFSCQDKYLTASTLNATGTLKNDANGDCLPKTIVGTYIAGKELGDTNYLFVTVDVKTDGNYSIKTNEVNGYSFSASGVFTGTGLKQIRLTGKGKPVTAGTNDLTVSFDTSVCHIRITVTTVGGTPPVAAFTLTGSPSSCINAVVAGTYAKAASLDTSNKVTLGVNVTAVGSWSFSTNTVNGYKFAGSGTFATTGTQNIVLVATGKPVTNGTDNFTVTGGGSFCTFPVTVLVTLAVSNNDLFPLTFSSYATYGDDISANPADTMIRIIIDSVTTGGNFYYILEEKHKAGPPTQFLYRKAADTYYEYASVDKYTTSFKYSPEIKKDIPVLKDNLLTDDKWSSDEYTGTATFGQKLYFKYDFYCIAGNVAATVNGKTFGNVCKIVIAPQIRSEVYYPFNSTGERIELWYAKGVGLIYSKKTNNFGYVEWLIRYWMVK